MKKIYCKTQTNRSTKFKENIYNINTGIKFKGQNFEFGICSVKYWGDFEPREEPLIELTIEGISYRINLIEFIKIMKKNLKGKHYRG